MSGTGGTAAANQTATTPGSAGNNASSSSNRGGNNNTGAASSLIALDERLANTREVGNQATWSLSSCKPGFGVEQLRDNSHESYWQSDGQLPHLVNICFKRKTTVSAVAVYTDFRLDESYTPSKISVRCGTNFNDLQEIEVVELTEPSGWVVVPLKDLNDRLVRSFMIQIAVIANHQQGRDTHLRQISIHSPIEEKPVTSAQYSAWSTKESLQFTNIR